MLSRLITSTPNVLQSSIQPESSNASGNIELNEFRQQLNEWSQKAGYPEERVEASRKIFLCFSQNLEELDLSDHFLKDLPECFKHLTSLTSLSLDANSFTELPSVVHEMTNLKSLSLDKNSIGSLPMDFWKNKVCLGRLSIQENDLDAFPDPPAKLQEPIFGRGPKIMGIPLNEAPRISELFLSGNKLKKVPENLEFFRCLQNLQLDRNKLTEIPESIWEMQSLGELNISRNPIRKFAAPQLKNNKKLSLSNSKGIFADEGIASAIRPALYKWRVAVSTVSS